MFGLVSRQKLALLTFLLILLHSLLNSTIVLAIGNKPSVSRKGKIVAENSPSAAVHKFIYNNEKICGDMFGHKGWLPAHKKCDIQCITGVHICQMPEEPSKASIQRCLILPEECQERLKQVINDFNLTNSTNFSAGSPPSIRPHPSGPSRRTFTSSLPSSNRLKETRNGVVGPPSSRSIMPPAIPVPLPPSPAGLPPSTTPPPNDHFLVPLSTDGVLLPLPEIVLSSSTFPPLAPPSWRPGKSKQKAFTSPPPKHQQQNYEHIVEPLTATTSTVTLPSSTTASIDSMDDIFDTLSNPSMWTEEPRSPYGSSSAVVTGSEEGYSFERHNSVVISPPSQTKYNVPAKVNEQSAEVEGSHVHIFGPPYSPTQGGVVLPTSSILPNMYSSLNEVKEMARKSKVNPNKNNAMAVQRAASTVEQIDLSTELNTKQKSGKPEKPWWTWRQVASKLKNKPFYVQESGVVLDRSIRCCEWALNGLCDRSWQRIRQLCPKSCGTVVCSSADGALSCNRMIDVDVIDCYEKRSRSKAFGTINLSSSHNETSENSSRERFQVFQPSAFQSTSPSDSASTKETFSKLVDENSFLKVFAVEDEIKRFNKLNTNQNFKTNV
uniref:ShKT domain-containing protein n=1 Tax=Ditylenchus dipsaci TaxID=166011 RepID=A0A915DTL3_9BILA